MSPALALCALLALQAADTKEYQLSLRTKDGSIFSGTARLPAKLTVTTKFGEFAPETATVSQFTRIDDGWTILASTGPVTGKL